MGWLSAIAPGWALKRELARLAIARLYKAAQPSHARVSPTDTRSGNSVMDHARHKLRAWGRHLDENHDLTHSMLSELAYQASAVTIEPRVMRPGGRVAEDVNDQLRSLWDRHCDELDQAGSMCWHDLSATMARTWLRDGEIFIRHRLGASASRNMIPYSLQALEPDFIPYDLQGREPRVVHGIELDDAERAVAYHVYREHPGESIGSRGFDATTVRVPAAEVTHLAVRRRLGQKRGASVLAPAITAIADVRDYEESERMAAKVSSSLCAAITRGADFSTVPTAVDSSSGERPMELQAGVIFDNLMPGEKVEVLDTNRPNPELSTFRSAMLRAVTAAIGVSYSTSTHDYGGTYSSQRQELVEIRLRYAQMRELYVHGLLRPVWRRFVQAVQLAGALRARGADPLTLFDFEAVPPPTPWIDPQKEANADKIAIETGIDSRHGVIRRRGADPRRVDDERRADTLPAPQDRPQMEVVG